MQIVGSGVPTLRWHRAQTAPARHPLRSAAALAWASYNSHAAPCRRHCKTTSRMLAWLLRAIGVLLMLSALGVALSRAPDRPAQSLVLRWAAPPSQFIEVKGQLVHLRDEGAGGVPLVLVHGTAASLHTWEGWVRALRTGRRIISLDLPGFGLTGPNASDDYRGDTLARFVLDVLDQLGVQGFDIAGNSLGGEVAWRVAHAAPQRVRRLVLVDASGYAFTALDVPLGFRLARLPGIAHLGDWLLPRSLIASSVRNVYGDPTQVSSELVDRYFEMTLRSGNRRALRLRLQQLQAGVDSARIGQLRLPTLILWGGRDRLIPPELAQRFLADIAGSQLVVFDDLGHVPHEEDPARTAAAVKAFLGP